jgi:hypothetical protein
LINKNTITDSKQIRGSIKIKNGIIIESIHTNSIDLCWHLFGAKTTIAHVDIGISSCTITTVELSFAQVHLGLP